MVAVCVALLPVILVASTFCLISMAFLPYLLGASIPTISKTPAPHFDVVMVIIVVAGVLAMCFSLFSSSGTTNLSSMFNYIFGDSFIRKPLDTAMIGLRKAQRNKMSLFTSSLLFSTAFIGVAMIPTKTEQKLFSTPLLEATHMEKSDLASSHNQTSSDQSQNSELLGMGKALLLIFLAEIGDKTFFVAMFLAMKFSRLAVFVGSLAALILMTILSACIGWALEGLVDRVILLWVGAIIYFVVGFWMLYDAINMTEDGGNREEAQEELVKEGLMDEGGLVGKDHEKGEKEKKEQSFGSEVMTAGFWEVVFRAFLLNTVAEFGDRTQIAIVVLCVDYSPVFIALGAILAFVLVTAGAVYLGHFLSDKISERTVTYAAAGVFIFFGLLSIVQIYMP